MVVSEQKSIENINTNFKYSRELSEFINRNTEIKLDSESTIDFSNIILQNQVSYQKETMPISDLLAGASAIASSSSSIVNGKPNLVYLQHDGTQDSFAESENTFDYEEATTTTSNKRKAANIGNNRNKRFSTASTTSSSLGELTTTKGTRGGRRGPRNPLVSSESGEDTTARFGNKVVVKGTEEYTERRSKNNDAVKKCRAKLQEKQAEREKRLKELTEENRKLNNTVDSLNKELNVLKGILSTMKPQYSIPSDIEEKIKKLESMILANNKI